MDKKFTNNTILTDTSYGRIYFVIPVNQTVDLDKNLIEYEFMLSVDKDMWDAVVYSKFKNKKLINILDYVVYQYSDCDFDGLVEANKEKIDLLINFLNYYISYANKLKNENFDLSVLFKAKVEEILKLKNTETEKNDSKEKLIYNTRKWLNPESSPYTGNIICFDGETTYDGQKYEESFVQISDCYHVAKIHKNDDPIEFINKIKLMKNELENFIKHLENKYVKH